MVFALYFGAVLIWVARNRVGALPHWLFYPGEILFVAGSALTAWSYSLLGRYLSPYAEVMSEHRVIERGPYRYIRHPGYLGQMIAFVGLGVALQSWVALVAILLLAGGLLASRILIEEELMATELGEPYVKYMARTKRLVPFIW